MVVVRKRQMKSARQLFSVVDVRQRLAASGEEIIRLVSRDFPAAAHAYLPGMALQYGNVSLFSLMSFYSMYY